MITCELEVEPLGDDFAWAGLTLETNGHSFEEVERALRLFIDALQERIDNKEKCPAHPEFSS